MPALLRFKTPGRGIQLNKPMAHVYTDTKPRDGARESIQSYSDESLQGAIQSLRKADYLGKWGQDRPADLEAEARRRKHKRRDSAQ